MSDTFVQSVSFTDTTIEIQYSDADDQTDFEAELKVRLLKLAPERPEYVEGFAELQELLTQLLDTAAVYQRNPPVSIPSRPRFSGGEDA